MSNQNTVILGLWPFSSQLEISSGFAFILFFVLAFLAGGCYMWLGACNDLKKSLKSAKEQIKDLEKQLKNLEK